MRGGPSAAARQKTRILLMPTQSTICDALAFIAEFGTHVSVRDSDAGASAYRYDARPAATKARRALAF